MPRRGNFGGVVRDYTPEEEAIADADDARAAAMEAERAIKRTALARLKAATGPVTRQDIQDLITALGL